MIFQHWNDAYFEHCSLRDLGHSIQLGHAAGSTCPQRYMTTKEFVILHVNGVHSVSLFFCGSSSAPPAYIQLLRSSWWPATPLEPRSACTFGLLRGFHYLNTLGKLPAWDMWSGIEAMSTNCSGVTPPNRYKVLLRSTQQFRDIKALKCGSRGHTSDGIDGTCEGELVITCPACPHPGINLPNDWKIRRAKACVPLNSLPNVH